MLDQLGQKPKSLDFCQKLIIKMVFTPPTTQTFRPVVVIAGYVACSILQVAFLKKYSLNSNKIKLITKAMLWLVKCPLFH
jgi:hypothetical protein